jgi:fluoride exporter
MTPVKGIENLCQWQEFLLHMKEEVDQMKLLLVMIGGFFGAICRYSLGEWLYSDNGFPLGTLFVNLLGCLALGWFLTFMSQNKTIKPEWTYLIGTGFIGSFTTFSTFTVESISLFQTGSILLALLYITTSTIAGLLLVYSGHRLALSSKEEGEPL